LTLKKLAIKEILCGFQYIKKGILLKSVCGRAQIKLALSCSGTPPCFPLKLSTSIRIFNMMKTHYGKAKKKKKKLSSLS
jgi:hypothetical protein